ncbi:MAG TPA: tyrosine-type recombinase/integrase [Nitrospirota bacterium]|nr:tyrosine-type recombinase/integrase [Nitrospirota bacterium]
MRGTGKAACGLSFPPREIILFAVNTGWRCSETLALTWDKVDLFRKTLIILGQKNRGKDTQPFNGQVLEILKTRNKVRSITSNLVFYNDEGGNLDGRNVLGPSPLRSRRRAHCRIHDRHTFATRLAQAVVDLCKIQN